MCYFRSLLSDKFKATISLSKQDTSDLNHDILFARTRQLPFEYDTIHNSLKPSLVTHKLSVCVPILL